MSFAASTSQTQHLADVFLAVAALSAHALLVLSPRGLTLYAKLNHVATVLLTIDRSLFVSYNYQEEDEVRLGIDVRTISEAFAQTGGGVRGGAAAAARTESAATTYISYSGAGHPLVVEFEETAISEKIEFATFYSDLSPPGSDDANEGNHLVINHRQIEFELILKSDVLANLLRDLQHINTAELYLFVSNEVRALGHARGGPQVVSLEVNFILRGPIGLLKLIFPTDRTVLEKIAVYAPAAEGGMVPLHRSVLSAYNFAQFHKIARAVRMLSKCKLSKDLDGTLTAQLLCNNARMALYAGTLINFTMLALVADEELLPASVNNAFDNESYQYVKDYGRGGRARGYVPVTEIDRTIEREGEQQGEGCGERQGEDGEPRGLVDVPLFL
jgi:cell cycle checkpoint protein